MWSVLTRALEANDVVIMGVSGRFDHWTVVRNISKSQMQLLDSDGAKVFNKSSVRVVQSRKIAQSKRLFTGPKFWC